MTKITTTSYRRNYYPYYRRSYYRRRFYKKYKYFIGQGNYYSHRHDVVLGLSFGEQTAGPMFSFSNQVVNVCSLHTLLKAGNTPISGFAEYKIKGIKIEIMPLNNSELSASNPIVVACAQGEWITYNELVECNRSLFCNISATTSKYFPINTSWTKNIQDDELNLNLKVNSLNNSKLSDYPRTYSVKVSIYALYRNSSK